MDDAARKFELFEILLNIGTIGNLISEHIATKYYEIKGNNVICTTIYSDYKILQTTNIQLSM